MQKWGAQLMDNKREIAEFDWAFEARKWIKV